MAGKVRDRSNPDRNDLAVLMFIASRFDTVDGLKEDYNLQQWSETRVQMMVDLGKKLLRGFAPAYFADSKYAKIASFEDAFPADCQKGRERLRALADYRELRTGTGEEGYNGEEEHATHHKLEIARLRKIGPPLRPRKHFTAKVLASIIRDAAILEQYPTQFNKLIASHAKTGPKDDYPMLKTTRMLTVDVEAMLRHKRDHLRRWAEMYSPRTLPLGKH